MAKQSKANRSQSNTTQRGVNNLSEQSSRYEHMNTGSNDRLLLHHKQMADIRITGRTLQTLPPPPLPAEALEEAYAAHYTRIKRTMLSAWVLVWVRAIDRRAERSGSRRKALLAAARHAVREQRKAMRCGHCVSEALSVIVSKSLDIASGIM